MTTEDRPDLRWGYGGRMRASRFILGLSTPEFAERFHVKRRTIQRIERGEDPLPIGLWCDVQDAVEDTVRKANSVLDALAERTSATEVLLPLDDADETAVVSVAYLLEPDTVTPTTEGDHAALRAGQERRDHDEVPGPYAGSGADRG